MDHREMDYLAQKYVAYLFEKIGKMMKRKTTQGKINDLIDLIFHPLFDEIPGIEWLDFIAHSINERELNFDKFIKYNMKTSKKRKRRRK